MPTTQPQHRLGVLMDQRRGELRLRWKDVAARAGISYEGIRAVRNGTGAIRALTELGIEDALQWERGSIRSVLDGAPPAPPPPMPPAELRDVLDYLQFKCASNTSAERGA